MDRKKIAELAEQSYKKGYNEGFYDAATEIKRLFDKAVTSYQETAEERLKEINKYWKDKTDEEIGKKRTDE